jgi:hypothetical protein
MKKTFRIYNQANRGIKNPSTEFYILHFVSQELIESLTYTKDNKQVSQFFEGSYSDAANIIVNNFLQIPQNKIGIYMGIFNFFIVLPEILASLFFGKIMEHWLDGSRMAAVTIGGVLIILAAFLTLRIKENE